MRYFTVAFLTKETTGTDMLGNPITKWLTAKTRYRGLFTEWSAEEIALEGREVTKSQRKLLTDAPLSVCRAADGVQADSGETFRVQSVKDLHGRWRLLYVERWRV